MSKGFVCYRERCVLWEECGGLKGGKGTVVFESNPKKKIFECAYFVEGKKRCGNLGKTEGEEI